MKYLVTLIFFFILVFGIQAQNSPSLKLKIGEVELKENKNQDIKDLDKSLYQGAYYLLIQFNQIPSIDETNRLKKEGVELISYIPDNAYIAKIDKSVIQKTTWKQNIRHISIYQPIFKISPSIQNTEGDIYVNILFHESIAETKARQLLEGKYKKWDEFYSSGKIVKIQTKKEWIPHLSTLPFVNYISLTTKDFDMNIEENKETARVGKVNHDLGLGLTGNGVTLSVGDGGAIEDHIDLNDRIQNENMVSGNSHGSQTAGIIAGEGLLDPTAKGFAPEALLYADFFSGVITNDDAYYSNFGVVISNNSYANGIEVDLCTEAGEYTAESVDIDGSLRTLDEVVHVFSSANDGGNTCAPFPLGYATVRNAWNSAKNTLTVGSTTYLDAASGFSSRGPVKDGRLKPEIVAVGSNVLSTSSNNNYSFGSGTSFSCPSVSGGLALLYEHYKNLNAGVNPKGDLMKAVVTNSARDLGNTGPDYIFGFGTLDMYRAAEVITNNYFMTGTIATGANNTHNIIVPAGANQLKVMLYWHDVEATASASPALVNNLDLTLQDPSMTTVFPLVLDPSAANCANLAVQGVDNLNNIEQIVIDNPAAGTFEVNVSGTSIPMGSQNYVIVYDIIEDHVSLASPMGGEFYSQSESINITWNASGFDANTFTLEYSLDNGSTWITISNSIPGTDRNYEWNVPATNTEEGLVRITWNSSGLGSDQSLSNFTIINTPTSLTLTPNCSNGVLINWNDSGAASYDVMEYTAGTWSVITNVTTTNYTVTGLTTGESYYYSVRPIDATGIVGHRMRGKSVVAMGTPSGVIASFPYLEDFESDNGDWASYGKNDSWEWGSPNSTIIDRAAEGSNCWITNLTGNYNNAESSYLISPCFDLSGMTNPELAFGFILDIEDADDGFGNPFYDYARVEYTTNGRNWTTLGTNGTGHNWYNNYMTNNVWDDTKGYWHSASYLIPTTASRVNFRVVFKSDNFAVQEGIALDNIMIHDAKEIYNGANTVVTEDVSGTDWIHYESGGQRVVSINPNGNNLGSTTADVYINTGTLRDNTLQYYLDRNWKITPTTTPASDVSVRLYLLDAEVEAMRAAAGGCPTCSTISDAFIAGVTKYSGLNENGDLSDNSSGIYSYFIPANSEFVPYANGYYVEFDTPGFSEFYINGGHTGMNLPLPVELIDFTLTKDHEDALLNWSTAAEINTDKFEVEVAKGSNGLMNNEFYRIGTIAAAGESTSVISYEFKDVESEKRGQRYYRIKMLDNDGTFEYTPTKMLDFGNDISVSLYPNPAKDKFVIELNSTIDTKAQLRIVDQIGRVILNNEIQINKGINTINNVDQKVKLPVGFYQIKLTIGDDQWIEKLIIRDL